MGGKRVFIMRHAKSSWVESDLPDVVRPLNPRGKRASNLMGDHLAKLHLQPDLVISSPATRAFHTAINISQKIGYRIKQIDVRPAIYFEGDSAYINAIKTLDESVESVFLFGHEPDCSEVCEYLSGEDIVKFPTGACFGMELEIHSWQDITALSGKKEFFLLPRELE